MGWFSEKKKREQTVAKPAAHTGARPAPPDGQQPMKDDEARLMAQALSLYLREKNRRGDG